jgi:hypothetical protein
MDLHFFPTNGNIISAACQSSNYDQLLYQGTTSVVPKNPRRKALVAGACIYNSHHAAAGRGEVRRNATGNPVAGVRIANPIHIPAHDLSTVALHDFPCSNSSKFLPLIQGKPCVPAAHRAGPTGLSYFYA